MYSHRERPFCYTPCKKSWKNFILAWFCTTWPADWFILPSNRWTHKNIWNRKDTTEALKKSLCSGHKKMTPRRSSARRQLALIWYKIYVEICTENRSGNCPKNCPICEKMGVLTTLCPPNFRQFRNKKDDSKTKEKVPKTQCFRDL